MSSQDDDGLLFIQDLNKRKSFLVYKKDVYWNPALKAAFMERMTGLWDESFCDPSKDVLPEPVFDESKLKLE